MEPGTDHASGQEPAPGDEVRQRPHRVRRSAAVLGTAVFCAVAGTLAGAVVFPVAHQGHTAVAPWAALRGTLEPASAAAPAARCQDTVTAPGAPAPLCASSTGPALGLDQAGAVSGWAATGTWAAAPAPVVASAPAAVVPSPASVAVPSGRPVPSSSGSSGSGGVTVPKGGSPTCTSLSPSQVATLRALFPSLRKAAPGQIVTVKVAGVTIHLKVGKSGLQICGGPLPPLPKAPSIPRLPGVPPVPVSGGGSGPSPGDLPIPGL